jgi:hypothetical protein
MRLTRRFRPLPPNLRTAHQARADWLAQAVILATLLILCACLAAAAITLKG